MCAQKTYRLRPISRNQRVGTKPSRRNASALEIVLKHIIPSHMLSYDMPLSFFIALCRTTRTLELTMSPPEYLPIHLGLDSNSSLDSIRWRPSSSERKLWFPKTKMADATKLYESCTIAKRLKSDTWHGQPRPKIGLESSGQKKLCSSWEVPCFDPCEDVTALTILSRLSKMDYTAYTRPIGAMSNGCGLM